MGDTMIYPTRAAFEAWARTEWPKLRELKWTTYDEDAGTDEAYPDILVGDAWIDLSSHWGAFQAALASHPQAWTRGELIEAINEDARFQRNVHETWRVAAAVIAADVALQRPLATGCLVCGKSCSSNMMIAESVANESTIAMAILRLNGSVEGHPTNRVNFLQRIDALRAKERLYEAAMEANEKMQHELDARPLAVEADLEAGVEKGARAIYDEWDRGKLSTMSGAMDAARAILVTMKVKP